MSYAMRETQEMVDREMEIMLQYLQRSGKQGRPAKLRPQKYSVDFAIFNSESRLVAYVEVKTANSDVCYLNAAKVARGAALADASGVPFVLVVAHGDEIGECLIWKDGATNLGHLRPCCVTDRRAGHNNDDDTEPCFIIPLNNFKWS